jgi:hypothetical protein
MMGISVLLMQRKASLALDYRAAMPYVDALMSGGSGGLGILVGRGMRGRRSDVVVTFRRRSGSGIRVIS